MRVFVAGGSGVIGRPLCDRLVRAGHEVIASTRSEQGARRLESLGVRAVTVDAFDAAQLTAAVEAARPAVVVNQLTSIPKRMNPRRVRAQMEPTNRLRRDVTPILVRAARAAGARRVISQSISFVYDPVGDGAATEEEPLYLGAPASFAGLVEAVDASERAVLTTPGVEGVVLRYGYLYGPGTNYSGDGAFAADVRRGRVPIVGGGAGVSSFVHVDDAAAATVRALEHGEPGVYNVVDDDPAPVREWLPAYARALRAPAPRRLPLWLGRLAGGPYAVYFMTRQRGASNGKAREGLGWVPARASWRQGLPADLEGTESGVRPTERDTPGRS